VLDFDSMRAPWPFVVFFAGCAHSTAQVLFLAPPVEVEGRPHLIYELHVANADALLGLEVLAEPGQSVLRSFDAAELTSRRSADVLFVELSLAAPPASISHRLHFRDRVETSAVLALPTESPIVLGPPLSGGPWVAIHHPDWPRGHRRVFYTIGGVARLPGRFAIDWVLAGEDGTTSHGDPDVTKNALGYGAEVLAVADAVVAAARDDMSESERVSQHPKHAPKDAAGNYVALEVAPGRFVFYEHLQPGSVRVRTGDRVRRGQPIARLGFTGDSTGPHLHMHVANASSTLGAEGLPFVLERFTLLGHYADLSKLGSAPWEPLQKLEAERRRERPAPNAVLRFE
jgi:murein DD-endopeptidase